MRRGWWWPGTWWARVVYRARLDTAAAHLRDLACLVDPLHRAGCLAYAAGRIRDGIDRVTRAYGYLPGWAEEDLWLADVLAALASAEGVRGSDLPRQRGPDDVEEVAGYVVERIAQGAPLELAYEVLAVDLAECLGGRADWIRDLGRPALATAS